MIELLKFKKDVEKGDPKAQYNLAVMYKNGQVFAKNYKLAVKWYRKSAEQGYERAKEVLKEMKDA